MRFRIGNVGTRRYLSLPLCCLVAGAVASTKKAEAQVEEGLAALEAADFPAATEAFEAELRSQGADRQSLAEAHRHLAMLRQMEGRLDDARTQVRLAIAMDPDALPPPAANSTVVSMFDAARASPESHTLELALEIVSDGQGQQVAQAHATFPAELTELVLEAQCQVATLHLAPVRERATTSPHILEIRLPMEVSGAVSCTATVATAFGAVLERAEAQGQLLPPPPESTDLVPPPPTPPRRGLWIGLGLGLGVAVAAAAAVVLGVFLSRPDHAEVGAVEIVGP